MKKLIALMLCLVLALSMSVTAFAEGEQTGTTTITAEVPEASYIIHIPADMTLEYGNSDSLLMGDLYVSDFVHVPVDSSVGVPAVYCHLTVTSLKKGTESIPVTYYMYNSINGTETGEEITDSDGWGYHLPENAKITFKCAVKQENWTSAAPGTYKATITFDFKIL